MTNEPFKKCTRCQRQYPRGDFPCAIARGRVIVRSWCSECLKQYHRERRAKRKATV